MMLLRLQASCCDYICNSASVIIIQFPTCVYAIKIFCSAKRLPAWGWENGSGHLEHPHGNFCIQQKVSRVIVRKYDARMLPGKVWMDHWDVMEKNKCKRHEYCWQMKVSMKHFDSVTKFRNYLFRDRKVLRFKMYAWNNTNRQIKCITI